MLQHLSWSAYGTGIAVLAVIYYGFIGLFYYRHELAILMCRLTGKPAPEIHTSGDLFLPPAALVGAIREDSTDIISQEELLFAVEGEDQPEQNGSVQPINPTMANPILLADLSEMVSETKTLIRVIHESQESKENFEILFRLIVQKYPDLAGTIYKEQINDYLLSEAAGHFPFSLTHGELSNLWLNDQQLQSA